MSRLDNTQCSHCGSNAIVGTGYTACVAKSNWEVLNFPMPNTQTKLLDDMKIWLISLCRECLSVGYTNFLLNSAKQTLNFLKWNVFLLIIGGVGYFALDTGFVHMICVLLVGFGICAIPIAIIVFLNTVRKLRSVKETGYFPEKEIDSAYKGEAMRIWEELEKENTENVFGTFELPKYKSLDEYKTISEEIKKKIRGIKNNRPERLKDVRYTSGTIENLRELLPNELKVLLDESL